MIERFGPAHRFVEVDATINPLAIMTYSPPNTTEGIELIAPEQPNDLPIEFMLMAGVAVVILVVAFVWRLCSNRKSENIAVPVTDLIGIRYTDTEANKLQAGEADEFLSVPVPPPLPPAVCPSNVPLEVLSDGRMQLMDEIRLLYAARNCNAK